MHPDLPLQLRGRAGCSVAGGLCALREYSRTAVPGRRRSHTSRVGASTRVCLGGRVASHVRAALKSRELLHTLEGRGCTNGSEVLKASISVAVSVGNRVRLEVCVLGDPNDGRVSSNRATANPILAVVQRITAESTARGLSRRDRVPELLDANQDSISCTCAHCASGRSVVNPRVPELVLIIVPSSRGYRASPVLRSAVNRDGVCGFVAIGVAKCNTLAQEGGVPQSHKTTLPISLPRIDNVVEDDVGPDASRRSHGISRHISCRGNAACGLLDLVIGKPAIRGVGTSSIPPCCGQRHFIRSFGGRGPGRATPNNAVLNRLDTRHSRAGVGDSSPHGSRGRCRGTVA